MSDDLRERIARIVHPLSWEPPLLPETYREAQRQSSLEVADALIADDIGEVSAERERANKLRRIIDGYDRTPAEERAKRAEERAEKLDDLAKRTKIRLDEELARSAALQARIDAAKAEALDELVEALRFSKLLWYPGYIGFIEERARGIRAALVSEEPAPEDHSSHEFCDRRLGCVLSEPAPEPPKLDPYAETPERVDALAREIKRINEVWGGPSMDEFKNDPPTRKHYSLARGVLTTLRNGVQS